jgi:glycerol-3-phosphate dehydrogenase
MVIESLKERGIMRRNAPHLVKDLSFVIPSYDWWSSPFYGIGLKIYDMMAGKLGLGPSTLLNREETINLIPNVKKTGLKGGVIYHDGQFDDSRMAISLALTAEQQGAIVCNYIKVESLIKNDNLISGVIAKDLLSNEEIKINCKVLINATGVFSDNILKMDNPDNPKLIKPSQGVHLVLDKKFLNGPHAIMVPHTSDGRVLFAVPWNNFVVVGTTDTLIDEISIEPKALDKEISFILENAGKYMTKTPKKSDIKSVFTGLRPLAADEGNTNETSEISRSHKIILSESGMISILGGKWTTYRKMSEDVINSALSVGGFPERECITQNLPIKGYDYNSNWENPMHVYGTEIDKIKSIDESNFNKSISKEFFITKNMIIWSIRNEMAFKLEDVLARRTRCLFLDVEETLKIAPKVLSIMAKEMNKNKEWVNTELKNFIKLALKYQKI